MDLEHISKALDDLMAEIKDFAKRSENDQVLYALDIQSAHECRVKRSEADQAAMGRDLQVTEESKARVASLVEDMEDLKNHRRALERVEIEKAHIIADAIRDGLRLLSTALRDHKLGD